MTQLDPTTATATPPGADKKQARRTPYPHLFRLLHWVLPAGMLVSVATGLSLHAVARPAWSLLAGTLPRWFWSGQVHLIHVIAAVVFFAALAAVLGIYLWRRVRRRWTHLALLGAGLATIASGLLLVNPVGPAWLYWTARAVHAVSGLVVLPVSLLWHAAEGFWPLRRALVPAFHPWASPCWRQLLYFVPLPLVAACLVLTALPAGPTGRILTARRIAAAGDYLGQLPWDDAPPLRIELAGGVGFDAGRTRVTLRALHDGRELLVLAEWLDPTEDRRYTPWEKTGGGWRRLATVPDDESVYYEDKFSLVFPTTPDWRFERFGCALYCHADGRRAYGYKGSEQIVDTWHWKSTRTDPVGQVDDKHWQGFDMSQKDVGRHGDPKTGGGYENNAAKGVDHPAFLSDDPSAVREGMIPREHAVPYEAAAAARLPDGTVVPGIILSAFQGDRGDASCRSEHTGGRWRVIMRRKLDTGSPYDVRFVPGASHPFGCAAFDHSSKRHAYGFSVYRLVLEP